MAADFPGSFAGYTLTCDESHQSSKVDTSGTAKALSATLAALNGDGGWGDERIVRVRVEACGDENEFGCEFAQGRQDAFAETCAKGFAARIR